MKTLIHEIGVIDKNGKKHQVCFKKGLNIVTGKSSTGKSALIEIFDYCFGSGEFTVPKGVITDNTIIYYVYLQVNEQNMVIARRPDIINKAFFRSEEFYKSDLIQSEYFDNRYFIPLDDYKKHLRSFFLDIDDVDESLAAKYNRRFNRKAATPSIRSFASFMLQHQNLVANKHALFYRFDEKEKRDQVIEHIKIFIGLVDQEYFLLSQEYERLTAEKNKLSRETDTQKRVAEDHKQRVEPVILQLYSMMGFEKPPISAQKILRNPQNAKDSLDKIIVPEKINHSSDAVTQRYNHLKNNLTIKTAELRKLHRQASSIRKNIEEDVRFVENGKGFLSPDKVQIAATVCPFCYSEQKNLNNSAEQLQQAIIKVSENLAHAKPIKAKFEASLVTIKREIEQLSQEVKSLSSQIYEIEQSEKQLSEKKSLYENILMTKARLFMMLDTLNLADDFDLDKRLKDIESQIKGISEKLSSYNIQNGLEEASGKVNKYMAEIGDHFEFEESYKPINLHFSFETFDLYHQGKNEKIYLRSMGSGANWLYSHVTLFLALHKYFSELGDKCSIPSVLFLDQPTQVYFPNFKRDVSESFSSQKSEDEKLRTKNERPIDEDIKAVENLFSQLSIYCNSIEEAIGFSPQLIVTDHADDLVLTNGVVFESLVNENRWRTRGFINPVEMEGL